MSLGHGSKIVTDGLVFAYDMGNEKKSWKGKPTENVIASAGKNCGIEYSGTSYPFVSQNINTQVQAAWAAGKTKFSMSFERKLYIDGELVGTLSDVWAGTTRWPTNGFGLGRDNNNSMYYFRGNMGPFKIYNRILTDNEIKQNFNAVRGRYGL